MNFLKSNPFVSALAGITILVCGVLFFLASKGGAKYDEAKVGFDESYAVVQLSESIPLYPKDENRDGKRKALGEYRESISELSSLFDKYRPGDIENNSPQGFANSLKKASEEASKALESGSCELPDKFFLGFEGYSEKLANKGATGALGYQLDGIKHALLGLAEARPSELIKIHREPIPEERNKKFKPKPNDVARNFAVEMTFRGSEASARQFISYLGETDLYYYVVRCVKIINEKDVPPKVSDAKFERDEPAAEPAVANPFGDFNFPGEDDAPVEEPAAEEVDDAPEPEEVDTSRILAQVLGGEEVVVFVRFDLSMFLPSKALPTP
ncbi:MAG: Amuc_1100 family pilus-like protein [Akkermansiaceae bacterium]|nr:Amuc_1100 family pilus-like protein [Akkermansiaceae bacterium]